MPGDTLGASCTRPSSTLIHLLPLLLEQARQEQWPFRKEQEEEEEEGWRGPMDLCSTQASSAGEEAIISCLAGGRKQRHPLPESSNLRSSHHCSGKKKSPTRLPWVTSKLRYSKAGKQNSLRPVIVNRPTWRPTCNGYFSQSDHSLTTVGAQEMNNI